MTKVIAEIGINFQGDLEKAKKLIRNAKNAGCWGVKFQFRELESFYASTDEIGDSIIIAEVEKNNLTFSNIKELSEYSKNLSLKFGMSFFREHDLDVYVENLEIPDFIKIPSAECLNKKLIDKCIDLSSNVFVSTGGHNIEDFIDTYKDKKYSSLIVLHCVANYPAAIGTQNLARIDLIKNHFEAGYSSHDQDYEGCILAIGKNIPWIERHLTLDKTGTGLDDSSSSDFNEMKKICDFARESKEIFFEYSKEINQGELLNMQNLGTGIYASKPMRKGDIFNLDKHLIKAPRKGISVGEYLKNYVDKKIIRDVLVGEPVTKDFFENFTLDLNDEDIDFCKANKISIPVRFHDLDLIKNEIGNKIYEFHLSYVETLNLNGTDKMHLISEDEIYSIHLPDYIPGNRILDPISLDKDIKEISNKIIKNISDFAKLIEDKTQHEVPIVGSFSQTCGRNIENFFDSLNNDFLSKQELNIYPQWLPKKAWYFGGTVELEVFNNEASIQLIEQFNMLICLDLCHVILSANSSGVDYKNWMNRLLRYSKHAHLADATGQDGEGLPFGDGEFMDYEKIFSTNQIKVIEVWQAHLNNGYGFKKAIKDLRREINE